MTANIPPSPVAAPRTTASAAAWPWRTTADSAAGTAMRRVAARRGALWRTLVGLAVAAVLAVWKPWLAIVVVAVSLVVLALALASPLGAYARLEELLGRFGHAVGTAVNWLLMPLLYVLLFLPVGLVLRAAGKLAPDPPPRPARRHLLDDAPAGAPRRALAGRGPGALPAPVLMTCDPRHQLLLPRLRRRLVVDGEIVAAAQEERFTRKKHDAGFPSRAVEYCLAEGGIGAGAGGLDHVAFYDKPLLKFHRILETYLGVAPRGLRSFVQAVPLWLREKLWIPPRIEESLADVRHRRRGRRRRAADPLHRAPRVARRQRVLPVAVRRGGDAHPRRRRRVGDHHRRRRRGRPARAPRARSAFPHSLGLLYSAFTYFTGFRVNSGEYKLMGLAPYGEPRYADRIREHLIDLRDDGSFRLNKEYFGYLDSLRMTNRRFERLFGGPPRRPETPITPARARPRPLGPGGDRGGGAALARFARRETGKRHLCLAGGVALNCVANGVLLREGLFDDLWIQPAAGDAGGALGAALAVWHNALGEPRRARRPPRPHARRLPRPGVPGRRDPRLPRRPRATRTASSTTTVGGRAGPPASPSENVVGLLQGRMEFGPRALGNRSIVGDARSPKMQSVMNLKIKYRESFRPFAPSVLAERVGEWFELDRRVALHAAGGAGAGGRGGRRPGRRASELDLSSGSTVPRSDVPAITHVDYSARVQTVHADTNPGYHAHPASSSASPAAR